MKIPFSKNGEAIFCLNMFPFLCKYVVGGNPYIEGNKCIHCAEDLLTVMDDFAWNWNLFQARDVWPAKTSIHPN